MTKSSIKHNTLVASKITNEGLLIVSDRLGYDPTNKPDINHSKIVLAGKYSLIAITGVGEFYKTVNDDRVIIFNAYEIANKYFDDVNNRDIDPESDLNGLAGEYVELFKSCSCDDISSLLKLNPKKEQIFLIHLYRYNSEKDIFEYYCLKFECSVRHHEVYPQYTISSPETLIYNVLRLRGYGEEGTSACNKLADKEKTLLGKEDTAFKDIKYLILKIMFIAHKLTEGSNKVIGSNVDVYLISPSEGIVEQEQNFDLNDVFK